MATLHFSTNLSISDCQLRLQRFLDTMSMTRVAEIHWHQEEQGAWCELCYGFPGTRMDIHLAPVDDHTEVLLGSRMVVRGWLLFSMALLAFLLVFFVAMGSVLMVPTLMLLWLPIVALWIQWRYCCNLSQLVIERVQTALPID